MSDLDIWLARCEATLHGNDIEGKLSREAALAALMVLREIVYSEFRSIQNAREGR